MEPDLRQPSEAARREFLLKMYDQLFNDINRHILTVWQSVGVLIGAFAIFALAEKGVLSTDVATTLIVLLSAWLLAHLHDASYWYNRNLVIIANIERQFLLQSDLKNIHYYFGKHRPVNKMISHLQIQYALGAFVGVLMVFIHFISRVAPGFEQPWSNFDPFRVLPYLTMVLAILYLRHFASQKKASYAEFLQNSPGIAIDTTGVSYGTGHGFRLTLKEYWHMLFTKNG